MKKLVFLIFAFAGQACIAQNDVLLSKAEDSLRRGVSFFHSINIHGGYVYYVTTDLSLRWGEVPTGANTIEVQPPGTPAVGQSFLAAYRSTSDEEALAAAKGAAYALISGQNYLGGWEHTINFAGPKRNTVSFDDDQSQSAISFLMAIDQEIEDELISEGVRRALDMMRMSQLDNGGWPHKYPGQGNYHDYATFNDEGINDCIRVMIEAYHFYKDERIEASLRKAARFLMISQLPPPQPGWAQQYNEFLQPAWARTFEPPSVCPSVTVNNINSLIDLHLALDHDAYLDPIPDSLRWLQEIRLENGKWARFVELGTGKALYYDRGRIRVDTLDQLHPERRTGYAYETDLMERLSSIQKRFEKVSGLGGGEFNADDELVSEERIVSLSRKVEAIIASQEASGAWITKNDRFKKKMPSGVRWNGQYEVMDRISSAVFNKNVSVLCEFLDIYRQRENQ